MSSEHPREVRRFVRAAYPQEVAQHFWACKLQWVVIVSSILYWLTERACGRAAAWPSSLAKTQLAAEVNERRLKDHDLCQRITGIRCCSCRQQSGLKPGVAILRSFIHSFIYIFAHCAIGFLESGRPCQCIWAQKFLTRVTKVNVKNFLEY